MEKIKTSQLLKSFLAERKLAFVVFFALFAIFAIVLSTFSLPLSPLLYALLLCAVAAFLFLCADFYRYCRAYFDMRAALAQLLSGAHPSYSGRTFRESCYLKQIYALCEKIRDAQNSAELSRTEMLDYCSLWAHQIKTPISALRLQSGNSTGAQALELLKIERYVEAVLCYLRLENSEGELLLSRCPLNRILEESVKKFAPFFIGEKLSLNLRKTDFVALTDERWLSFVVEQLLSNAVKYAPAGTVTIFEEEGRLHIADTGVGIAAEDLPRVFEKGYTGRCGRADKRATGIGLYLVQKILKKLQNSVEISSAQGCGTEVVIDLNRIPQVDE